MKDLLIRYARAVQWGLLGAVCLLGVLAIFTYALRAAQHGQVAGLIEKYRNSGEAAKPDDEAGEDAKDNKNAKDKKGPKKAKPPKDPQVERITQRGIFSPPKTKATFKAELIGVIGDAAIFKDGKIVKVGETYKNAKVIQIGADFVEVQFEGKPIKLAVFGGKPGAPPGAPPGGRTMPGRAAPRGVRVAAGAPKLPPEIIKKMVERLKSLPPEQRERAMARMPAEYRKYIEQAE